MSAATDAVVLHLWQAVQVVVDLAASACVRLGLGSPATYGDAFRLLADARVLLARVHAVAVTAGGDLRAFLVALRDRTG